MAELPRIALSRLRAKPSASTESGPEGGFEALGVHHPDANLLAAFAEKTLTETERVHVLLHLTDCVECREVAAFTMPELLVPAETHESGHSERRSYWPILRWGALAAMMAALAVVITLHPGLWQNQAGVTSSVQPAVPAGKIEGPHSKASSPVAAQSAKPVERKTSVAAQHTSSQAGALNQSLREYQNPSRNALLSQHAARQQVTTLASTQPPAPIQGAPAIMMSQNSVAAPTAATPVTPPASAGSRWFVNSEGRVIRSIEGSDTFEKVPISAGISFRTVAAFEGDVWAGGAGGALFHSANGGDTWTRVVVSAAGNSINETITGIQIHDAQHLTITTVSDTQWQSNDGGQHWQKPL